MKQGKDTFTQKATGKKADEKKRKIAEKWSGKQTLVRYGKNLGENMTSDKNDDYNRN
jgi:hypothetical protein